MNTMNDNAYSERDWQLFRKKYPEWRERYAQSKLAEYSHILEMDNSSVEKLFSIQEQIISDLRSPAMELPNRYSRSNLLSNTIALIQANVIAVEEIADFSEQFKNHVQLYLKTLESF